MTIKDIILNLLFPQKPYCIACNKHLKLGESLICSECADNLLPIMPPICPKCGKPLDPTMVLQNCSQVLCSDCRMTSHLFVQARAYGHYDGVLKQLIYVFKYRRRPEISGFLGDKMAETLKKLKWPCFDYIVPVPLHKSRLQERGYNQAQLLADDISKKINVPVYNCLIRTKPTEHQTLLDKRLRRQNIEEAFKALRSFKLSGKKLLLIDDVYTTGATADSCTKALLSAGADKVYVFTCARG